MSDIAVITICFNNLEELKKTCESVDAQTLHPAEHWIINGSTNNEIADWLQSIAQPAYRKWVNERDNGISDAFNKGIAKAMVGVTHLLNSGDVYASNYVLQNMDVFFAKYPAVQWVSGKLKTLRGGHWVTVGKPFDKKLLYKGMRSVSHPTWFVRKAVYDKIGLYNSDYKIAMDYDMMCRIANAPYTFIDEAITVFDPTGISSNNYLKGLAESKKIYESHFGFSLQLVVWQLRLKLLNALMKSPIGKGLYAIKLKLGLENK